MEKTVSTVSGKQLPEIKFRAGAISATVWKNNGVRQNGEASEYRSISFQRTYKDKSGAWKTTTSLRMNDLPKAEVVLHKAYEYLVMSNRSSAPVAIEEDVVY
ncbi:MAG TPA: hypothetical protein VJK52_02045 [Candidatus Nanoarchaeia archaeon]|nr:hypothetical protein [Candidatus Nanoarchaeia archaeon]